MVLDTLSAADRVNLLEVYARSVILLELGRCEDWAGLFEPHAFIQTRCRDSLVQTFRGRRELLELGRRMIEGDFDIAMGQLSPPARLRHCLSDISLFAGSAGSASAYAHLTVSSIRGSEPPHWLASGLYSDQVRKCSAGCWQFVSRAFAGDSSDRVTADPARLRVGLAHAGT